MADDRDHELDSRWWGPLKRSQMNGVVKIRLGRQIFGDRGWNITLERRQ